jgi:soluble lytic murein transglycosylase-like protein
MTSLFLIAMYIGQTQQGGSSPVNLKTYMLAQHILSIHPGAGEDAYRLADSILTESLVKGLDVATVTAIAWTESAFRPWVKGSSGEIGLWQLLPRNWLAKPYEEVRGLSPSWKRLSKLEKKELCKDIKVGTHFATWIIAWHADRCTEETAVCYARYQSGSTKVSPGYVRRLRERSRIVRGILDGE